MNKVIIILFMVTSVVFGASAQIETVNIKGPNGNLVADVFTPQLNSGEQKPVAILMHGFGGNRRGPLLDAIFDKLSSEGIGVIRFDFDGCGESDGEFVDMTVPKEIGDAHAVYSYVKELPWVSKIYLIGHSQGGVVASMTAGDLGTKALGGLALLAPAAVLREDAIRGTNHGANYNSLDPPAFVPLDSGLKLGRDYIVTAQTLPIYNTASGYQGPVLMIHGTSDIVVPYTYSLRYNDIYRNGSVRLIKGVDHIFKGYEKEAADIIGDYFMNCVSDYVL